MGRYLLSNLRIIVMQYGLWYLAVISAVAAAVTIFDKARSKSCGWRVPEKTLLLISALGGSAAMYAVMRIIHHKTRHAKFMIGIPLILAVQAVLVTILIIIA